MTHRPLLFVVPEMRATLSGGNLYNLGITSALHDAGVDLGVVDLGGGEAALRAACGPCFVDSLYLAELPRLKQAMPATGATLYLLVHYLPSLVAHGGIPSSAELSEAERAALAAADGFCVPSDFMAGALTRLATPRRPVIVVAPAVEPDATARRETGEVVRAVVIANLVPGKGVLAFLDALAPHLRDGARFELEVIGSCTSDGDYGAACRARVARDPALAGAVHFAGALGHTATLDRLRASDFLVSASQMESFGLALAEARALGVPIVARAGGNAAALVEERAGGRLCDSHEALAAECARLARDPAELGRRRRAAQAVRLPPRTWADAARELLSALASV